VLERAPISTIHALCAAMLQERPLECGVVPGFRMADETEADVLFAEAWEEWLTERLTGSDDVLMEALDAEIPLEGQNQYGERSSLRGLARQLVEQRDLKPLVAEAESDPQAARAELLARASRGRELAARAKPGDALAARLELLGLFADAARGLEGRGLLAHLSRIEVIPKNFGFRPRWPSDEALAEARELAVFTKGAQAPGRGPARRGGALPEKEGPAGRPRLPRPAGARA
jgi:ATP-dependent helicase/nuclease subunit A